MINYNMPDHEYFAIDALSASDLKKFRNSPSSYKLYKEEPPKSSATMSLGTLTHLRVLEGQEAVNRAIRERFAVLSLDDPNAPVNPKTGDFYGRGTKAFSEWYENHGNGKEILLPEDFQKLNGMLDGLARNEYAMRWLTKEGDAEVVIQDEYKTDVDGTEVIIPRKCKIDKLLKNKQAIIDLKTAADSSEWVFQKDVYKWGYHIQNMHYISVAQSEFPDLEVFVFIVVQNQPPFDAAVYVLDILPLAWGEYEGMLQRFAKCKTNNNFLVGHSDNQTEPKTITIGNI